MREKEQNAISGMRKGRVGDDKKGGRCVAKHSEEGATVKKAAAGAARSKGVKGEGRKGYIYLIRAGIFIYYNNDTSHVSLSLSSSLILVGLGSSSRGGGSGWR
jgi:hypothetical protein